MLSWPAGNHYCLRDGANRRSGAAILAVTALFAMGCGERATRSSARQPCASDNGGLTLPDGFCATVFADNVGQARRLVVTRNGTVFVKTWSEDSANDTLQPDGFVVGLRDTTGDGKADIIRRFGGRAQSSSHIRTHLALYSGQRECFAESPPWRLVLSSDLGADPREALRPCATNGEPGASSAAQTALPELTFYNGGMFPARYHGGVFMAFRGSWNRAPFPKAGYNVLFVPFSGGGPTGEYEVFADGFAGAASSPGEASHRPAGIATGPDGALYVSDDVRGRIWRVVYNGRRSAPQR